MQSRVAVCAGAVVIIAAVQKPTCQYAKKNISYRLCSYLISSQCELYEPDLNVTVISKWVRGIS